MPRCRAVNHPKNEWLPTTWGVDVSVSTPHLTASSKKPFLSARCSSLQFEGGEARLVGGTLAADSPAAGQSPSCHAAEATVVAVLRDRHLVVPAAPVLQRSTKSSYRDTHPEEEARRLLG